MVDKIHLSTIGVSQSHAIQVLAKLGDVAEDGLGLVLNVPLLEYLSLSVELGRVPRRLLGTPFSLPQ